MGDFGGKIREGPFSDMQVHKSYRKDMRALSRILALLSKPQLYMIYMTLMAICLWQEQIKDLK